MAFPEKRTSVAHQSSSSSNSFRHFLNSKSSKLSSSPSLCICIMFSFISFPFIFFSFICPEFVSYFSVMLSFLSVKFCFYYCLSTGCKSFCDLLSIPLNSVNSHFFGKSSEFTMNFGSIGGIFFRFFVTIT